MSNPRHLDMDKINEERRKKRGDAPPPTIVLGGERWELPHDPAYEFVVALQEGDARRALQELLGDRFDAFWALRPSQEDVAGIFEHLGELYPKDEQESQVPSEPS